MILIGSIMELKKTEKKDFTSAHQKVIKKIASMASNGLEIHFITGNRKEAVHKLVPTSMGSIKVSHRLTLSLHGKNTLFLHGDIFDFSMRHAHFLSNLGSVGFSLLQSFSEGRKSLLRQIGKAPNPFLTSDKNVNQSDLQQISRFEKKIAKMAIQHQYDHVVCGYSHSPKKEIMETKRGECLYLNSGDWVEHMTALEYSFKRWKLYRYQNDKLASFFMDEELKAMDMKELIAQITQNKKQEKQSQIKNSVEFNSIKHL